jgi:RNA polymerase sigma factor (sigma-70 family)
LSATTLDADDDAALLSAASRGEENALDALMLRHQDALHHFILRATRDETLARETVQETFVRVWFKARTYAPRSNATAKTWIYAIALNIMRDRARSRRRESRIFAEPDLSGDGKARDSAIAHDTQTVAPDKDSEKREGIEALQNAICRLPEKLRLPLVMCSLENMPHKEAAAILGTSPKSVELRIRRAKERLRELLTKD